MLAKIAIRLKKSGLAVAVTMMGGIVAVDIQLICCNQAGRVAQKSSLKSCVLKECSHTYISPAGGQSTPQLHVFDAQSLPGIEPATASSPSSATAVRPYPESVKGLPPLKSQWFIFGTQTSYKLITVAAICNWSPSNTYT